MPLYKTTTAMLVTFAIVIGLVVIAYILISSGPATYAVGAADIEIEFLLTDKVSHHAVPNAAIKVRLDDTALRQRYESLFSAVSILGFTAAPNGGGPVNALSGLVSRPEIYITLITDDTGRARFVRQKNDFEHVTRGWKTKTVFFIAWCSVYVSRQGYQSIENLCLGSTPYEDLGFTDGDVRRLLVHIALTKDP